mmetsp:Transcript_21228/g.58981  ORF Transcript_21228/g.58981 Transcript_21228/m.58981 type:complete len:212 (+) Transcript_21228:1905-2540(+)
MDWLEFPSFPAKLLGSQTFHLVTALPGTVLSVQRGCLSRAPCAAFGSHTCTLSVPKQLLDDLRLRLRGDLLSVPACNYAVHVGSPNHCHHRLHGVEGLVQAVARPLRASKRQPSLGHHVPVDPRSAVTGIGQHISRTHTVLTGSSCVDCPGHEDVALFNDGQFGPREVDDCVLAPQLEHGLFLLDRLLHSDLVFDFRSRQLGELCNLDKRA